jgi:FkbM family methyltransferase
MSSGATQMFGNLFVWLEFYRREAQKVGALGALKLKALRGYNRFALRHGWPEFWPVIRIKVPGYDLRVYARTGTSDCAVLEQIFFEREYKPLENLGDVRAIIDCGANVGYSSLYFLNRYPRARVVAVEPDPDNAAMWQRNLARYGNRAQLIVSGVWSHAGRLALVRGEYGDGRAWATQVREVAAGEPDAADSFAATDIPSLLSLAGGFADILKVDIERSEAVVFQGAPEWLPSVRNIAIELHDAECEQVFFAAMREYDFELVRSGELTICKNIRPIDKPVVVA